MTAGRAVLLGCGTSTGVPLVGCRCEVCRSDDPRNRRSRASLWLEIDGVRLLVDTSTDLRRQALDHDLPGIDHVLYTHTHADHIHGIDDVRMFNFLQRRRISAHAAPPVAERLRRMFPYIFDPDPTHGSTVPMIDLHLLEGPIRVGDGEVVPVPIEHGRDQIHGYRVGTLAYLTDISRLPEASRPLLRGIRTMIVGALRHDPHPHHFTVAQAVALAAELGVEDTILTHMSHDLEYQRLRRSLPPGVRPGYDGLTVPIAWA